MKKMCVGITGLDVSDHPMSGLGIARCLREQKGIRIIGLTYNALSSGCYSREVFDEVHLISDPMQEGHKFFTDIVKLKEKRGLQVVIPSIPWEIPLYAELRGRFRRRKIGVLLPKKENILDTLDPRITSFALAYGIRTPPYCFLQDERDLIWKLSTLQFPVIIKGNIENQIAYNADELRVLVSHSFAYGERQLCIQKYLLGEEYSVAALASEDSRLRGISIVKKVVVTDQGTPWIIVSVYDEILANFTRALIQYLQWVGPLELRFIKEAFLWGYSLIKFHPCFPSWIYLSAKIGQNLPLKALKLASGINPRGSTKYTTGTMYIRNAKDIICDLHTFSQLSTSGRLIYHV